MHHPTDRIAHTTTFVISVVEHRMEQEIALWINVNPWQSERSSGLNG